MEPRHRRLHARRNGPHTHTKRIDIVTDVVYVTASPSFGGKVVGFTTLGEPIAKTTTEAPPTVQVVTTAQPTTTDTPPPATTTKATKSTSSDTPSATSDIDTSSDSSTLTSSASNSESLPTTTEPTVDSTRGFSQSSSVPSASSTSEPVEGISGGAKVGLALAGVFGFLVLCSLIIFLYRKKSRQRSQEAYGKPEDEKVGGGDQAGVFSNQLSRTATVTSEKAPRVPSLRPVTRFLPDLTVTPPPAVNSGPNARSRQAPAANPPLGLVRSESRKAVPPPLVLAKNDDDGPSGPPSATTINSTAPLIDRSQPSPSTSTFSADYTDAGGSVVATPVTAIPVAAAANNTSPVHRVQMDFKPSMGDELELRVGQLVRLLHEYDDGWALCIRLDRSQQGVCPRTCLSQRPVKPRSQGPPPPGARGPPRPGYGPNGRPQSPMGNRGPPRPYSPAGGPRAQSPGPNGIQFPHPRPHSPANSRPPSPAGGYAKKQYRPATSQQAMPIVRAQSPTTAVSRSIPSVLRTGPAQVTMTTDIPEGGPAMPTAAMPKQQSPPSSPPRPAVALVRPSPLSHEQNNGAEPQQAQPAFHAM